MTNFQTGQFLNVEILSETEEKMRVKMGGPGITRELMNTLRRTFLEDIATMQPEEAQIFLNTSRMEDEMLVQRLGLVVFDSKDVNKFKFADECECSRLRIREMCGQCGVRFHLRVKNFDRKENRLVTSSDLIPESDHTTVLPVHGRKRRNKEKKTIDDEKGQKRRDEEYEDCEDDDSIVLTLLKPGEEIILSFIVRKGTTRRNKHNKFTTVGAIGVKNPAIIKIDQDKIKNLTIQQKREIVRQSPEQLYIYDEQKNLLLTKDDPNESLICKFYKDVSRLVAKFGQPDAIQVLDNTDYFIFTVTTIGGQTPRQIFRSAFLKLLDTLYIIYYSLPAVKQK